MLWCPSKGQGLATTTPFLTSRQESTAGILLAFKRKKVHLKSKNSFPASVRYAALITSSSLNFKKSVTVACEETSGTQKRLQKRTQNLLGGRTVLRVIF